MIDESLIKSNFIGRDSFRWWVGQVAPIDSLKGQNEDGGWGNRYKVRILGYHPFSKEDLSDEDLPYASVLLPTTAGTGGALFAKSVRLRPSDVVLGFFLDGDNAQLPVILGAFGRTDDVSNGAPSIGFEPFTSYTENVKPPVGKVGITKESNSRGEGKYQNSSVTRKVNEPSDDQQISNNFGQQSVSANDCDDNFLTEVSTTLNNLFVSVDSGNDFLGDVAQATSKLQKLSNGLVSNMMGKLYEKLVPELQNGLDVLYNSILPIAGPKAAIAAQAALIPSVQSMEGILECAPGKIVSGLNKTIRNLLDDALLSVSNSGVCVAEQFTASLLDGIINDVSSELENTLGTLTSILSPTFKVQDVLRSSSDLFRSAGAFIDCNQNNNKCAGKVSVRKVGGNAVKPFDVSAALDNVLGNLNSGGGTPFIKPDCANVDFCGPPVVNIFGGDGFGGAAKAILGGIVDNTEGLSDVTADLSRTGSIIGVEITNPGEGYFTTPPLITFEDPCNQGYGAVGEAIVDFNPDSPTYGQIVNITILSDGENYPVSPVDDGDAINSDSIPFGVVDTVVINSGRGYDDVVVTDGNTDYDITIDNGRIISAKPLNNVKIDQIPSISITSSTGSGALIKPIIGRLPLTPQGEVIQVIDCISPNINNIVGYVDGKPYTGPYHFHPTRGVKMVGAVHLPIPHSIIYDTPQESFRAARSKIGITTMTQTSTPTPTIQTPRVEETMTETPSTPTPPPSSPPPSSPPPSSPPSGGGGYGGY